jgi:putative ABC transport system permease protein
MHGVWNDLRYGARMLVRSPAFTAVAVLALSLGIGANTAIFSVVNGVLLKPLPFHDPDRIVWMAEIQEGQLGFPFAAAEYLAFRDEGTKLEHVAAVRTLGYNLAGAGAPERVRGAVATPSLFPLLGVEAQLGRTLIKGQDDLPGAPRVALLAHAFWQQHFGADPNVLGQTVRLNDESVEIVGVLPQGFGFLGSRDLWLNPADVVPEVFPNFKRDPGSDAAMHYLLLIGRLAQDTTREEAEAQLDHVAHRLSAERSANHGVQLVPLHEQATGASRATLLVLFVAVGFVLLIACANVANLLLARSTTRVREVAVRSALGASRMRLVRQLLTESLLLGAISGAIGLLLAWWGIEALKAAAPAQLPRASSVRVDGLVLAFTLGVAFLTSLLFGLAPAFHAARGEAEGLKEGGAGARSSGRNRLRGALIAAEMGLSVVLLAGGGLLWRSFSQLLAVEPGFDPHNLVTLEVAFSGAKYVEPGRTAAFLRDLVPRLASLPGVEGVAVSNDLPIAGIDTSIYPQIEGRSDDRADAILTGLHAANPGYFQAMRVPLLRGRAFEESDVDGAQLVTVVNATAAARFWPDADPVGQRLRTSDSESEPWLTVVGVVGDVRYNGLNQAIMPDIYTPLAQRSWTAAVLALRTRSKPESLVQAARQEVQALDATQPLFGVRTMDDVLAETVAPRRFSLMLLGILAGLAVALAAVGLYGVMAYVVTQRSQEIGVRVALGAEPRDILRLIVGQGMKLTAVGLAVGIALALGLTRFLESMLFAVSPTDPATFVGVTVVLLAVGIAACWIPARRAVRVDPVASLRHE